MAEICFFGGLVHYKAPSPSSLRYSVFRSKPNHYTSHSLMSASVSPECHSTVEPPSLLVFSGGTGFNGVVEELKKLTTRVAHVLPVSDDGGSTAEIVRVLGSSVYVSAVATGGPAVGDIRSRCLRLSDESTSEALAVRRLLGHRLPIDAHNAKKDWYDIVEGNHSLWDGVSRPYRETIRAFLVYFQNEDGTIIRGQNEISHPTNGTIQTVDKVFPPVNPTVLEQLKSVDCIVYAMGSLFTSICPSLVLLGVGEIISSRSCRKVLLLNGTQDRETSGFTASCFVTAIADALNRTHGDPNIRLKNPPGYYINTLLVPKDGEIAVDLKQLSEQGIVDVRVVETIRDPKHGVLFNPSSLINTLAGLVE
ncbi:hypothetical protein Bca4012_036917 [Brassica carinata]